MDSRGVVALALLLVGAVVAPGAAQSTQSTPSEGGTSIIDLQNEQVNIELQAQRQTVDADEPVVLDLSAVSYVTNDEPITLQLILESASGVSISKTTARRGGGNQFSTVAKLEPGAAESIRVLVNPSEPGTYEITAEVIYFVGTDRESSTGERTSIEITQNPPPKGLLWWTPTILGIGASALLLGAVFLESAGARVGRWNEFGEFWSAQVLVVIGGVAIGVAGSWFSSYSESVTSPGAVGVVLGVVLVASGTVLALIGRIGGFSDRVRILYAYSGATLVLAIPLQILCSVIASAVTSGAVQF